MIEVWSYTEEEVDAHFGRLQACLREIELPKADGSSRKADADEFMLMVSHRTETGDRDHPALVLAFKHRDTRNYVFVHVSHPDETLSELRLEVPRTDKYFMRGTFDRIEWPNETEGGAAR